MNPGMLKMLTASTKGGIATLILVGALYLAGEIEAGTAIITAGVALAGVIAPETKIREKIREIRGR